MKKRFSNTVVGFFIIALGFLLGYLNLTDIPNASLFSVLLSLVLVLTGAVILYKAGRHFQHGERIPEMKYHKVGQSLLEKNNELMHSYDKHSRIRDKLKTIRHMS